MKDKRINQYGQKRCIEVFLLTVIVTTCSLRLSASVLANQIKQDQDIIINYMYNNSRYPMKAIEMGMEGLVTVSFRINDKGKMSKLKLIEQQDPLLDNEISRELYGKEAKNGVIIIESKKNVRYKTIFPKIKRKDGETLWIGGVDSFDDDVVQSFSYGFIEYDRNGFKENLIHTAINHFSLSYPLYEKNSVFEVSYTDTVFSRTYKMENNKIKWINGKPYEEIVAVSIFRKLGSLYVTNDDIKSRSKKIPSRYLEKNGKLFYWHDSNIPATEESLALLKKFGLIKEPQKSEDFDEVRTIIFDDEKGVIYFFCRENPLIFESMQTNRPLGTYTPPNLECGSRGIPYPR